MEHESPVSGLRIGLGVVFFFVVISLSFVSASMTGWSFIEKGPERLQSNWGLLIGSTIEGLIAIAGARLIIGWRLFSPWLLAALVIPGFYTLDTLGLV